MKVGDWILIAVRLQQLKGDFKQGRSKLEAAIDNLNDITEGLSPIDLLVGVLPVNICLENWSKSDGN